MILKLIYVCIPKKNKINKDLNDMGYFDFLVRMNVGINERVQWYLLFTLSKFYIS